MRPWFRFNPLAPLVGSYRWRSKFGGMAVPDARKLRELEEENGRLKRLVADQALDVQMLKEALSKKW